MGFSRKSFLCDIVLYIETREKIVLGMKACSLVMPTFFDALSYKNNGFTKCEYVKDLKRK